MEPKSWKWIQGIVIALAGALGIAVAIWYQGRPPVRLVADPVTTTPKQHGKLLTNQPPVTPYIHSPLTASKKTASATGPDSTPASLPVSPQGAANSEQNVHVDPFVHSGVPAANPSSVPIGLPGEPPVSGSYLPNAAPNTVPPPYVPSPGGVSAYPSSTPPAGAGGSFSGETPANGAGNSAVGSVPTPSPASGPASGVIGSGSGPVDAGGSRPAGSGTGTPAGGTGIPAGGAGTSPGL